jgi:hypothetical protein
MRLEHVLTGVCGLVLTSAPTWAAGTITGVSVDKPIVTLSTSSGDASVNVQIDGTGLCSKVRLRCDFGNPSEVPPIVPPNQPFPIKGLKCTYMAAGTFTVLAGPQPPSNDCSGVVQTQVEVRPPIKLKLIKEIVKSIAVVPHGTFANFTVSTTEPAAFELQASTDPAMKGGSLVNVESAIFNLQYVTNWPTHLSNLKPNTLFHYLLKVKPQKGLPYLKKGTFTTLKRRVAVTFEKIHMVDDSDDLSDCDCAFGFSVPGAPLEVYTGSVASGTDVHPNRTVTVNNAPAALKLKVLGWDDDEDELIPFGPFLISVLNTCGPLQKPGGECDGDGAQGSTMVDADSSGLDENTGGGTFKIDAFGPSLKFTVTGSYKVSYQ